MKRTKQALSKWSKECYGDIFKQLVITEDIVRIKEQLFEDSPTAANRPILNRAQVEFYKYLKFEEEFWRQKAGIQWFTEGDRNTKKIHNIVKGRKKRMEINRVQKTDGSWAEGNEVLEEAVNFYKEQFTESSVEDDTSLNDLIPSLVTEEENDLLNRQPCLEEVKMVVFELNGNSDSGPDGFTGHFYQVCWDIVGKDIFEVVNAFFSGMTLPKSITHTNLVLIPKKEKVVSFFDLRPISLSNFVNKVISRIIHDRLEGILPKFISPNQSGFTKGRSITENILLAQEIVVDIRKRSKTANVVFKLDMAKAYDRVSWSFLMKVLDKMGFNKLVTDKIWRLVANNWYSVLINGQYYGLFHSTRGVKQGDPLSPSLFIMTVEVLSRALNNLNSLPGFKGFGLPKWSERTTHLAYTDDTIVFDSADSYSLRMIMKTLNEYEKQSG